MESSAAKRWLFAAWAMGLVATLGSLFFAEVMKLPPCSLCWYQRIAMYPLVIILTVGILAEDAKVNRYAFPFLGLGLALALYHNLLYYGVIPAGISPCTEGVPCTSRQLEWLGVITIPLLSLVGFSAIGVCLFQFQRKLGSSSK